VWEFAHLMLDIIHGLTVKHIPCHSQRCQACFQERINDSLQIIALASVREP
jgi:hypothetical protein